MTTYRFLPNNKINKKKNLYIIKIDVYLFNFSPVKKKKERKKVYFYIPNPFNVLIIFGESRIFMCPVFSSGSHLAMRNSRKSLSVSSYNV